jgi:hypothetical protein
MSTTAVEVSGTHDANVTASQTAVESLVGTNSRGGTMLPKKPNAGLEDKRAACRVISVDPDLERQINELLRDVQDYDYIEHPRGLRYIPSGSSKDSFPLEIDDNRGFLSPIPYEDKDWEEDPSWRFAEYYKERYEGNSKQEMERYRIFRRGFRQWRLREWRDRWGWYRATEILGRELVFRDFEAYDAKTGKHVPWGAMTNAEQDAFSTALAQAEWYEGSCCRMSLNQ